MTEKAAALSSDGRNDVSGTPKNSGLGPFDANHLGFANQITLTLDRADGLADSTLHRRVGDQDDGLLAFRRSRLLGVLDDRFQRDLLPGKMGRDLCRSAGDVTRQLDLSGAQFMELRKERYKAWQATDAYRKQLKELGEGGRDREEIDGFLFEFAAEEYLSADPEAVKD